MTKEQAIEWLKSLNYCDGEETQEVAQAIDMAIKALEQNTVSQETYDSEYLARKQAEQELYEIQQNTSDDCVSRQAVLDSLMKYEKPCDDRQDFYLDSTTEFEEEIKEMPPVTPTQTWIPLVWDEYPTVDIDGNDDYVYAVDYSVPMPKEDEWVLITDENHNVVSVQYDGYDFGDYARENILAWQPLPQPYEEKRGNENG